MIRVRILLSDGALVNRAIDGLDPDDEVYEIAMESTGQPAIEWETISDEPRSLRRNPNMQNVRKMPPAISLDLETWGRSAGCAIRSIGATVFEPDTGMLLDDHFYCNITDESCRKLGLHFDPDTVDFWERQSDEAKAMLARDQIEVHHAMSSFATWYRSMIRKHIITLPAPNDTMDIWGNDSVFDVGILGAPYQQAYRNTPWQFWAARDMRTIVALGQHLGVNIKRDLKFHGIPHYALDDAKYQAKVIGVTQATIIARATKPLVSITA